MSVVRLIAATRSSNILISGKIIKEMPGSVASGTHCSSENGANLARFEVCNSSAAEESRFLGLAQCRWASRCSEKLNFRNAENYSLNNMAPRPRTHD